MTPVSRVTRANRVPYRPTQGPLLSTIVGNASRNSVVGQSHGDKPRDRRGGSTIHHRGVSPDETEVKPASRSPPMPRGCVIPCCARQLPYKGARGSGTRACSPPCSHAMMCAPQSGNRCSGPSIGGEGARASSGDQGLALLRPRAGPAARRVSTLQWCRVCCESLEPYHGGFNAENVSPNLPA